MGKEITAIIIENKSVAKDIFELVLQTELGLLCTPGQFANVGVPNDALLLKRPISINAYDAKSGQMTLIYKIVGKGTVALSRMKMGEPVDILVPLGKGYPDLKTFKSVFLVGGGIGCAPLEYVMDMYTNHDYASFLGFDTESSIYHQQSFSEKSESIVFSTLDGSLGTKGFVTQPLLDALTAKKPDMVLACGPTPMLKALKSIVEAEKIPCYISVEERMGCGMGGCAVCACKTKDGYKKACVEGPVFALSEVDFD